MVKFLLKKSYLRKNLKEVDFNDLWNHDGVFTTMWIYGSPQKILFFKSHIENLIKSLKVYNIYEKNVKSQILELININIEKNKKYNHLLRLALNKKLITISLRNKVKTDKNFSLNLIKYKRINPEHKNLKYKIILKHLSKLNTTKSDIALTVGNKVLETGTSNLLFVSNSKIFSPMKNFYKGTNLKFFEKKINIIRKNIYLNELNNFDEIILVGSGKGVTQVSNIKEIKWKRKNNKIYKKLLSIYNREKKKQIIFINSYERSK
tara:strand:+ start:667 stop:1455 length:789 start_codon:yes stop_codon:yes gene_type:complete